MAQYFIPIPFVPISGLLSHHSSSYSRSNARYATRSAAIKMYNKGVHCEEQNNYGDAAECFRQALQIDPTMVEAQTAIGNALYNSGSYEQALAELDNASRLRPRDANTWFVLGQCSMRLQKHDQALAAFQHCLRLAPSGSDAGFAREYADILEHSAFAKPGTTDFTGNYLNDSADGT